MCGGSTGLALFGLALLSRDKIGVKRKGSVQPPPITQPPTGETIVPEGTDSGISGTETFWALFAFHDFHFEPYFHDVSGFSKTPPAFSSLGLSFVCIFRSVIGLCVCILFDFFFPIVFTSHPLKTRKQSKQQKCRREGRFSLFPFSIFYVVVLRSLFHFLYFLLKDLCVSCQQRNVSQSFARFFLSCPLIVFLLLWVYFFSFWWSCVYTSLVYTFEQGKRGRERQNVACRVMSTETR